MRHVVCVSKTVLLRVRERDRGREGGRDGGESRLVRVTGGGGGAGETETVFIPAVEVGQVYGRREREAGRAGEEGR